MNNMKIQSARKATHTWLAGKIKCGNCGYALMSIYNPSGKQYLRCTKRLDNKSCPGCGKIITSELEAVVYQQMVKKLASYKTLTGKKKAAKANPKITALQVELAHVDSEIEKLVDSLTGANNVLFSYVNVKIAELDGRKHMKKKVILISKSSVALLLVSLQDTFSISASICQSFTLRSFISNIYEYLRGAKIALDTASTE